MVRRGLAKLVHAPPRSTRLPLKRHFVYSSSLFTTTALSLFPDLDTSEPSVKPQDLLRAQKLEALLDYLTARSPNPFRVWTYYQDVITVADHREIPLRVHQDVLRKCTHSTTDLRVVAARHTYGSDSPRVAQVHEARFKAVLQNIRSAGWEPTPDDYHFVLEQYAAAGHYTGSMEVYRGLKRKGLEPRSKTFGLCLRAIAHRLSLACPTSYRPTLIQETGKECGYLLKEMYATGAPFASANLDLTVRILKETLDEQGFDKLLKIVYGIDLAFPDRSYVADAGDSSIGAIFGGVLNNNRVPLPFSTSALNTTIDMLGRLGNVSKLVQAFEVLTQPLPPHVQSSSWFDDDGDDYGTPPLESHTPLPHASPNTTTYNTLLRHLSRLGHATLARHYIVQAIRLEWDVDRALRGTLLSGKLPHEVPKPSFAINRGTLLPLFGEANRSKELQLLRWLESRLPRILRRKRWNLAWYTKFRAGLSDPQGGGSSSPPDLAENSTTPTNASGLSPPPPPIPHTSTDEVPLSTPLASDPDQTTGSNRDTVPAPEPDLDAVTTPDPPTTSFDINLHIKILQRDIAEIESFAVHVKEIKARTAQRIKERLGRRVWNDKDVYLQTDGRRKVSRKAWQKLVNFRPPQNHRRSQAGTETGTGGGP